MLKIQRYLSGIYETDFARQSINFLSSSWRRDHFMSRKTNIFRTRSSVDWKKGWLTSSANWSRYYSFSSHRRSMPL